MILVTFLAAGMLQAQDAKKEKKTKIDTLVCWTALDCKNCQAKVEKNIAFEKGVKGLEVDLEKKLVTVAYRVDKTNPQKIEKAIQDLGFKTEMIKPRKKKKKE